jgi:hypothetical protein
MGTKRNAEELQIVGKDREGWTKTLKRHPEVIEMMVYKRK